MNPHDFDDDCVCLLCGFDGAEWWEANRALEPCERTPAPSCSEAA